MNTLKDGDIIEGSIKGKPCVGRLSIKKKEMYFCQNEHNGEPCKNKYGFKYSWVFHFESSGLFTDNVIITKVNNKDINIEHIDLSITNNQIIFSHLIINKNEINIKKSITICNYKDHPDCCGSSILYNFDKSDKMEYSRYKDIISNKEYLNALKSNFKSLNKRDKIVHLAHFQTTAIKLIEILGFKKISEYENPNSNNMINIYNYL